MIIQHVGQKNLTVPGPDWGLQVTEPGFPSVAGGWWDDFGAIGCCVGAYQGKAAANYAASLVNLANPGVNDLIEIGGGPPGWNAVQGWFNLLALGRCLDTGLVPAADQSWSFLVQVANGVVNDRVPIGGGTAVNRQMAINALFGGARVRYSNGGNLDVVPALPTGNLGIAGATGYRDGAADPGVIPVWIGGTIFSIYVGALNRAGAALALWDGDIWAASVYSCVLTAPQMAAVEAWMAAI